jgi:hypothetical protein
MVSDRLRALLRLLGRYGVLYPGAVAAATYGGAVLSGVAFGRLLFFLFAGTVILAGFSVASSGPTAVAGSGGDALAVGEDLSVADSGQPSDGVARWGNVFFVKLALFALGLAVVLTGLTVATI